MSADLKRRILAPLNNGISLLLKLGCVSVVVEHTTETLYDGILPLSKVTRPLVDFAYFHFNTENLIFSKLWVYDILSQLFSKSSKYLEINNDKTKNRIYY